MLKYLVKNGLAYHKIVIYKTVGGTTLNVKPDVAILVENGRQMNWRTSVGRRQISRWSRNYRWEIEASQRAANRVFSRWYIQGDDVDCNNIVNWSYDILGGIMSPYMDGHLGCFLQWRVFLSKRIDIIRKRMSADDNTLNLETNLRMVAAKNRFHNTKYYTKT